jgi:hypothetical protein
VPKQEVAKRLVQEPHGSVSVSRNVEYGMEVSEPMVDVVFVNVKKSC